ncbi:CPBP family intramembrane glutamic endopeptidase [Oceanirhabdus sp. W0125-5]|uniref:CPBP family intramembrane glutamic endopeptidase n=1 Tax=Oceanirhabdus sp. W0125-5 TaxID=2999116 RepID=UPI0022F34116|nr:CPBP family intramembrane glutamic endopeptidase [Oceanirhabdus sp. W0125-5]WBW98110.1 CPBP family intramembrane metalloprotease [Oceanirhabdus sp. W0125-5]
MNKSKNNVQFLRKTIHDGIFQLFVFTAIPLVVYLLRYRKIDGFTEHIGLYMPDNLMSFVIVFLLMRTMSRLIKKISRCLLSPSSLKNYSNNGFIMSFKEQGFCETTILSLIFMAVITTGLSEEILFRGFITKGLIASLGFLVGNIVQSVIFALPHAVPQYMENKDFKAALFEFIRVFIMAFVMGWLMVFICNGSILPLWISHGVGNVIGFYKGAFGKEQDKILEV